MITLKVFVIHKIISWLKIKIRCFSWLARTTGKHWLKTLWKARRFSPFFANETFLFFLRFFLYFPLVPFLEANKKKNHSIFIQQLEYIKKTTIITLDNININQDQLDDSWNFYDMAGNKMKMSLFLVSEKLLKSR